MALPRRCKRCRCYVAPQLTRCPRCHKLAPPIIADQLSKADRAAERAKRDQKVPVILQKKMRWAPSATAIAAHEVLLAEAQRKLEKADTPRMRNTLRSEIRCIKQFLAKRSTGNNCWTTELVHFKHHNAIIYLSPKGKRYVLTGKDGPADLIIQYRKRVGIPFSRLQLFEKSPYARMKRAEEQVEKEHTKRKTAKRERRSKKRRNVAA